MADEPLAQQLVVLGQLLAEVDSRLAKAPVAPVGLEDLKQSVDNLRTSMWAILRVGHGYAATSRIERLKLRRAIDGLRAIQQDLATRPNGALQPEHRELAAVAQELVARVGGS